MRVEWGKKDSEGLIYMRRSQNAIASVDGHNPRVLQQNLKRIGLRVVGWKYSAFGAMSELKRIEKQRVVWRRDYVAI